jgi:glycosyltransferase involved in cell wall biosynthesis
MKITLISPYFPHPKRGEFFGAERYLENLVLNLRKMGNDLKIVTSFWNGGKRHSCYKGIPVLKILDSKSLFGKYGMRSSFHYISFGINVFRKKNFKFFKDSDVILLKPPIAFSRFNRMKKIPIISIFFHLHLLPAYLYAEKHVFKISKNITTLSSFPMSQIIDYFQIDEKDIKIFPPGIDLDVFKPSNATNEIREKYGDNIALFSGLMINRKRVSVLLRAMPRIIKEIPDVHLLLTGQGYALEYYKKLSRSLGVQKNVTFLGFVEEEMLLKLYASSDIFIFPSKMEGFGQVILESMASGTPVICANKIPMSEIIGDGGITFELNNPRDLAEKTISLLKNREALSELANNGLREVKKYTWEHISQQYFEYIKKVVKREELQY